MTKMDSKHLHCQDAFTTYNHLRRDRTFLLCYPSSVFIQLPLLDVINITSQRVMVFSDFFWSEGLGDLFSEHFRSAKKQGIGVDLLHRPVGRNSWVKVPKFAAVVGSPDESSTAMISMIWIPGSEIWDSALGMS